MLCVSGYLNSLGNTFWGRFECFGDLGDIEKWGCERLRKRSGLGDIEKAISAHEHALRLTPGGHPRFFNNLLLVVLNA
jgi:hypothetical protein